MIPAISDWLAQAGPDFEVGFSLFCRYSPNRSLISWIGRKRDMEMLRYELAKLNRYATDPVNPSVVVTVAQATAQPAADRPAAAAPKVKAAEPQRPKIVFRTYDERRTRRADLPPHLQEVYDEVSGDYKIRRAYHEKMKAASTNADRAGLRARLLECQDRIEGNWSRIDNYLYETTTRQIEEKFNERSCRAYICKALKQETLSPKRADGVRIRAKALLEHGCSLSPETQQLLRDRKLL